MTFDILIYIILTIGLALLVGVWSGFKLATLKSGAPFIPNPPPAPEPRVVVNVPPDFKGFESLPPTQVEGARAALFYLVYTKAVDAFTSDGQAYLSQSEEVEAYNSASKAVDMVFGPIQS